VTRTPAPSTTALWLATHHGWHVFPLGRNKKPLAGCERCRTTSTLPVAERCHDHTTCQCLARGDGAHCHAVWAATTNPAVITGWARTHTPVWAVDCGRSGLLCADLDSHGGTPPAQPLNGRPWPPEAPPPTDGLDTWRGLVGPLAAGLDLDATLAVATPSNGLHVYYQAEPGRWASSTPRIVNGRVTSGVGWQIDIKAHGGYVILPGSRTNAGTYRRASTADLPRPMPDVVETELRRVGLDKRAQAEKERLRRAHYQPPSSRVDTATSAAAGNRGVRYADAALISACVELAAMDSDGGGRNRKLFRSASRLAGMVEAGWIDRDRVERDLADAASTALLPASEIRYAIASGFRHPRLVNLERAA
jgi:Bifunctional DNA primase/polymerase, N-terminal